MRGRVLVLEGERESVCVCACACACACVFMLAPSVAQGGKVHRALQVAPQGERLLCDRLDCAVLEAKGTAALRRRVARPAIANDAPSSQYGAKDPFRDRFLQRFEQTFEALFRCSPAEQENIRRTVKMWAQGEIFPRDRCEAVLRDPTKTVAASEDASAVGSDSAVPHNVSWRASHTIW